GSWANFLRVDLLEFLERSEGIRNANCQIRQPVGPEEIQCGVLCLLHVQPFRSTRPQFRTEYVATQRPLDLGRLVRGVGEELINFALDTKMRVGCQPMTCRLIGIESQETGKLSSSHSPLGQAHIASEVVIEPTPSELTGLIQHCFQQLWLTGRTDVATVLHFDKVKLKRSAWRAAHKNQVRA